MKFRTVTVKELLSDISMGPFGSNIKRDCYVEQGIPYLNGSNLSGFKLKEETFNYVTEVKADSLGRAVAHRGDVIVTHRGTLGQIVYIPETSKYDRYVTGNSQFRLTCNDEILPEYLVYYFHSPVGRHKLLSNASQVGVPALARPTGTFQQLEIELPDIAYQKKVCSILSAVEEKIECNERINENLEQQAAAYFYQQFIVNADPSWKEGAISDLGTVVGGSTPSKSKPEYYTDNGIAWITPKDLSVDKSKFISHGADDITELGLRNSSATIMPAGTVLFSSRAPIGYIAIADGEVTTNQGFKSVVPNSNVGTAFVYYFLKNALPTIESMASGSTFKEISGSAMRTVPAIIPDDESLQEFSDFCEPLFQQQRTLEAENRSLAELRDSLLPKLMSGELDISALDL